MDESARILQDLYDSEINFTIVTFWDAGFEVKLGDQLNGFAATGWVNNFSEAVEWLRLRTIAEYPESVFAKAYQR
jgi:hypothetical protein